MRKLSWNILGTKISNTICSLRCCSICTAPDSKPTNTCPSSFLRWWLLKYRLRIRGFSRSWCRTRSWTIPFSTPLSFTRRSMKRRLSEAHLTSTELSRLVTWSMNSNLRSRNLVKWREWTSQCTNLLKKKNFKGKQDLVIGGKILNLTIPMRNLKKINRWAPIRSKSWKNRR